MQIIDKLKERFSGLRAAFSQHRTYVRSTTASRRDERVAGTKYRYISKPIPDEVRLALALGLRSTAGKLMRAPSNKGQTFSTGRGEARRAADDMARATGMNNKQRRRYRAELRRAMSELEIPS